MLSSTIRSRDSDMTVLWSKPSHFCNFIKLHYTLLIIFTECHDTEIGMFEHSGEMNYIQFDPEFVPKLSIDLIKPMTDDQVKNPAYGRQSISRPMRIEAPIPKKSCQ